MALRPQQDKNQNKKGKRRRKRRNSPAKLVRKVLRNFSDLIDRDGKVEREEKVEAVKTLQRCAAKQTSVNSKMKELRIKFKQKAQKKERSIEEAKRKQAERLRNRVVQKVGFQAAKLTLSLFFPLATVIPDIDFPDIDFPDIDFPDIDFPDIDFPDIDSLSLEDFLDIPDISEFLSADINFDDLLNEVGDAFDTADLEDLVDDLNFDSIDLGELVGIEGQLDETLDWLDEMLLKLD
ncbi:MAG: YjdF family protein [Symploca sp. SIO2E9]|nr:YjdF family protein [Symploca sp. SIO2E9]